MNLGRGGHSYIPCTPNPIQFLQLLYITCTPPLVLKARAPHDGSAFCIGLSRLEVPKQTLGGMPLGLGMVMKINFLNFHVGVYNYSFSICI